MEYSKSSRKQIIRYHNLISACGFIICLCGPFFAYGLYEQTKNGGHGIGLFIVFVAAGVFSNLPYLFLHRFNEHGIKFGGETFKWDEISRVEKTPNSLTFYKENGVYATLKTPFSFIKVDENWRVITEIYPPLEEKLA